MVELKGLKSMMEIVVAVLVMFSMVSIIIVSYGKQQEKHRRMRQWMKEQLKQDKEL